MIWRDDDIGVDTDVAQLRAVDDLFQAHRVPHTIAVLAAGLDGRPDLVSLIRERAMIPQLHGWTHLDLTSDAAALASIPRAVDAMARLFERRPTVLYPPWNRTNATVAAAAAAIGLTVSAEKVSLSQFIRAGGHVREDTINFHYWAGEDVAQIAPALEVDLARRRSMKVTDYCPRAAPFDTYLKGRNLVGVEVGVDVGAHAEALLRHCDIATLHLVDRWPKDYHFGYCQGRLSSLGFRPRFTQIQESSLQAAKRFQPASLDFVYVDQEHDPAVVAADLQAWWPLVKAGGVLGYRNYTRAPTPLSTTIDAFVSALGSDVTATIETGEIVLVKR